MVTLLPEPDSPTTPSTSPSSRVRSMRSTARSVPWEVGNSTLRFSISSRGMGSALQLGVERIAQAVTEKVEGEHGDEDGEARERGDPPGAQHELAGIGEHRAPFRGRRLGT